MKPEALIVAGALALVAVALWPAKPEPHTSA
jgi:hypothetical protein